MLKTRGLSVVCLFLPFLPICGCGDDDDGHDVDAGTDAGIDAETPDGNETPLVVTSTNPDDGDADIHLDAMIAVSFDRELAPDSIDEEALVAVGADERVRGQVTATAISIILVAPALKPNTEYTVTVSTAVRSIDGASLASPYEFSFTTGETYLDGTRPRGEDFRPLGDRYEFAPKVEYLLLGLDDEDNVQLRDPLEFNGPEPPEDPSADLVYAESNTTLLTTVTKTAATGNLDDDFYDEVVAVSWPVAGAGSLTIFDHGEGTHASTTVPDEDLSLVIDDRPDGSYRYDVALGDVNGDDIDEILIAGVIDGATGAERLGKVWILDHSVSSPELLGTIDLTGEFDAGQGNLGLDRIAITAGNFDEDAADEIAVATHLAGQTQASSIVFDDAASDFAEIDHQLLGEGLDLQAGAWGERAIQIAAGNADSDRQDEILVGWGLWYPVEGPDFTYSLLLLDDAERTFDLLDTHSDQFDHGDEGPPMDGIAFVDLNGDGMSEILAFGGFFAYQSYVDTPAMVPLWDAGICEGGWSPFGDWSFTVGDVNGDLRDDVITYRYGEVRAVGCVERPHYNPNTGVLESITNEMAQVDFRGPYTDSMLDNTIIAAPNVDQDSVVLQQGGQVPDPDAPPPEPGDPTPTVYSEHSVYFADNRLIAVVAAPPCADGIGQNVDGCSAGFGTSVGGSVSAGVTVAGRAGILVGMEAEVQGGFLFGTITLAKIEAEFTAEIEISGYVSSTSSTTQTITNTTSYDQDLVIFSATPYDRYVYSVISHPDSSLREHVVTVDVPQPPRVFAVSRDFYNATNGEQMDVGPTILPNRPGDLDSYPRHADVSAYLTPPHVPLGSIGPVTVNEGTGTQSLEQDLETEVGVGGEITLSVDAMGKVCGSMVCGGVTYGFSLGGSFETTVSSGTLFMSEVGAIDADHYATERYDYGLFAYQMEVQDPTGATMQSFVVVNHWVN